MQYCLYIHVLYLYKNSQTKHCLYILYKNSQTQYCLAVVLVSHLIYTYCICIRIHRPNIAYTYCICLRIHRPNIAYTYCICIRIHRPKIAYTYCICIRIHRPSIVCCISITPYLYILYLYKNSHNYATLSIHTCTVSV